MRVTTGVMLVAGVAVAATVAWFVVRADRTGALIPVTDLVASLDRAELRPAAAGFVVAPVTIGDETHRAISTPGASRMTWEMRLPDRAFVQVAVALKPEAWTEEGDGVLFRIGVAEGRAFEDLVTRLVNPYHDPGDRRWIPLTVDLRGHSGFQWSLFYHPSRLTWRLVFNTNAGLPGSSDTRADLPLWGDPGVFRLGPR